MGFCLLAFPRKHEFESPAVREVIPDWLTNFFPYRAMSPLLFKLTERKIRPFVGEHMSRGLCEGFFCKLTLRH